MSEAALRMEGVTRHFGRKLAVDEMSLDVAPGTVLGLVGRNGAGKTTTLRLAHGLLHPDRGEIRVLGLDPVRDGLEVRTRVALLSEEGSLYPWMRLGEVLDFGAALHPRWDRKLAEHLVERLELDRRERVSGLSRGTRAKIALLLAVASRPELLLLDDPTAGLDPLVRREILQEILGTTAADGGAVIYASHLVHDIERVADRVAYLDGGRVELEGPLEEIKRRVRRYRAVYPEPPPVCPELPGEIDRTIDGRLMAVISDDEAGETERVLRRSGAATIEVESLSLEEILVACLRKGKPRDGDRV